ncbi:MAG: ADP-ribosylation factor-like protein [Candidatus Lokiarchaeota archaeon]
MKNRAIKVIISGLDNAGKTSILTAIDKKYDFRKDILELKPTIKVEYQRTKFLGQDVIFWDMGGQEKYRELYRIRKDVYFSETDLILYVIDIQDRERLKTSLDYFNSILSYFIESDEKVPIIVTFHKYDPEIQDYDEINKDVNDLKRKVKSRYPEFEFLFQQTSIYDIISIVQLISYGLSVFDKNFFELSLLLQSQLSKFECFSLILFDQNGIIVSEFYKEMILPEYYIRLIESIKEHLFVTRRIDEENYKDDYNFIAIENEMVSLLHSFDIHNFRFYISAIMEEKIKNDFIQDFPDFIDELSSILEYLV